MGFFFFGLFILPLSFLLALVWFVTKRSLFGYALAIMWGTLVAKGILGSIAHFFTAKKTLEREDIYGEYVIDRTKFPGRQADWQYNHFRLEITQRGKVYFRVTENERIVRTYEANYSFPRTSGTPTISCYFDRPAHHIVAQDPTLYRQPFSFYFVFESSKFGNVFFTKGTLESAR